MSANELIKHMVSLRNEEQRRVLMGFFKTGPGEYGEGDEFLGLKVPQTREVVKNIWKDFPLSEIPELLMSKWHEVRLCGLLILVAKFEKLATKRLLHDAEAIKKRDEILAMYLQYAERSMLSRRITGTSWTCLHQRYLEPPSYPPKRGRIGSVRCWTNWQPAIICGSRG